MLHPTVMRDEVVVGPRKSDPKCGLNLLRVFYRGVPLCICVDNKPASLLAYPAQIMHAKIVVHGQRCANLEHRRPGLRSDRLGKRFEERISLTSCELSMDAFTYE